MENILSKVFKSGSVFVIFPFEFSYPFRHLQYNFKSCHYFEEILSFCFVLSFVRSITSPLGILIGIDL